MMDAREFLDPFEHLLDDLAPPARAREIEHTGELGPLWSGLEESGFLDALAPEADGGAGLSLLEAYPLLQALGARAVPAPVAETMVARALLAKAGVERPKGPIVMADLNDLSSPVIPLARVAFYALLGTGDKLVLTRVQTADVLPTGAHNSLAAVLRWREAPQGPVLAAPPGGLRATCAVLRAAAIAGAADRLLAMSVAYANERTQFGKPIGKQQALQQQLAVMAEETVAARLAAQFGCAGGLPPRLQAAAVAKATAGRAAIQVAQTAHAVHGAIGISEEYDLQLYSRRLHEWRLADGSESYWDEVLGAARLGGAPVSTVDFIRSLEREPA